MSALIGLARLFYSAWINHPANPTASFAGKTILITGANTGLGFEAAVKFAELGASKIILGVRSIEKGNAAKKTLEERSQRKGIAEVWQVDMASYDSIKAFASRASNELDGLDVALLNAGVMKFQWKTSTYGWEEMIQINALSTVLLGLLLLPKLRESSKPENLSYLAFVSSGTYRTVKMTPEHRNSLAILDSYNNEKDFRPSPYYALSKLFLMCAMRAMAEKEGADPGVVITSVCPGLVKTELARDFTITPLKRFAGQILTFFQRTTEVGARSLVSVVTLGKKGHGQFWQHDQIQKDGGIFAEADGKKLQEQISHEILDALRKDVPDILDQQR
ncbi:NAD(P)-binding protein [Rhizodiscina lignyota]|uniref:NAD(P)-binding protein n=1 Tax=Rhizodiscina lignyota TaxID=1504668 RepID=A0A9P4IB57_9PEZI|nr:NAD(P)-binding protein [Rhizodiscina lignyota]